MRIAYMLTSLGMGGAEKQVVALAERMQARGHAVLLLVLRERQAEEWATRFEVAYLGVRKSPGSVMQGMMRARRLLHAFRPDLLHSHTYPANMMARVLRLMGAAPVLSTIHNVYEGGRARMLSYWLTDVLSLRATAVSEAVAQTFVESKAVPRSKCVAMRNAMDAREFRPDSARRERTRAEMSAGDDFVWLAAGRDVEAKDFPNLLRAFGKVQLERRGTQLWIAGERAPQAAKQELDLPDSMAERVRFLGLRHDMPALLDAADGFVLSSAWEGMPLVVGEAMAMEKPVVSTDVGGVRELMGGTGTVVAARNAERLAEGMIGVMQRTHESRAAMGREARERIEDEFDFEKRADEWEELYRVLLTAR